MARPPTWYDLLGVDPGASPAEVRRAYRQQAQRWHPDRHAGTAEAHDRFVRIQQAYAILRDPARRADYDKSPTPTPTPDPAPQPAAPALRKGDDLHLFVRVCIQTLLRGGRIQAEGSAGIACPRCHHGCPGCGYAGQVLIRRRWVLHVPPGHDPARWLRLSGAGHAGPFFPLPGDVFVRLLPKPRAGWSWNWKRRRLERRVRVPGWFWRHGGKLELRSPLGSWICLTLEPGAPRRWRRVEGLPGVAPLQAWVWVGVGPWFSWGARRGC